MSLGGIRKVSPSIAYSTLSYSTKVGQPQSNNVAGGRQWLNRAWLLPRLERIERRKTSLTCPKRHERDGRPEPACIECQTAGIKCRYVLPSPAHARMPGKARILRAAQSIREHSSDNSGQPIRDPPNSDCWIYTRRLSSSKGRSTSTPRHTFTIKTKTNHEGLKQASFNYINVKAHHITYMAKTSQLLPVKPMMLSHLCHNPLCVNPQHCHWELEAQKSRRRRCATGRHKCQCEPRCLLQT
jgi:hypothetical protein